jgi:hypothetical protein
MTGLVVGLGCFGLHVATTLVWLRRSGRVSPVARHAVSALASHALVVGFAAIWAGQFDYWAAAAVSGFGAVVWLFAYSALYKSVSLRILGELHRSAGHALSLDAITARYVRPEFENRTGVLVRMGCVREVEGRYEVTRKGRDVATRIAVVQWLFGIVASGMYGDPEDQPTNSGITRAFSTPVRR